jgi:hypothetical protein
MNAPLSLFPARITLFHSRAASVPEDRVSVSAGCWENVTFSYFTEK